MRYAFAVLIASFAALCCASGASAQTASPQEKNRSFQEYAPWLDPSLKLRDYHIHLRGGMTAEMAVERAEKTGVRSGVLENHGREWPLSSNELLDEFITGVEKVNQTLPKNKKLRIGIQVNDRDWYKTIDPKIYRRLDYVLADTMIMGKRPDGSDERLWQLPKANVTYLPDFIADRYDELWTEERMTALIQAAIDNNVALEIQVESAFPKPKFVELALKMGAKLEFGSNNFDAAMKDTAAWKNVIERFNIKPENLWRDRKDERLVNGAK